MPVDYSQTWNSPHISRFAHLKQIVTLKLGWEDVRFGNKYKDIQYHSLYDLRLITIWNSHIAPPKVYGKIWDAWLIHIVSCCIPLYYALIAEQ